MRKDLKQALLKLHEAHMSVQALGTQENIELMSKYPYAEKVGKEVWRHPLSHFWEIIEKNLMESKKLLERIYTTLPKERKKVEERAKKSPPAKRGRKPKDKNGESGDGNKRPPTEGGVAPVPQERKKRGRPKKS